jgi:hypothetical protein
MRKSFLWLTCGLLPYLSFAQNLQEALLYNQTDLLGSPRYVSMAGAFTSLGNDLSGVSDNPAGLSVFRQDVAEISFGFRTRTSTANYFNVSSREALTDAVLGVAGLVKEIPNPENTDYRFHFGFTIRQVARFDKEWTVKGQNPNYSIIDQWIANSNGIDPDNLLSNGLLFERMAWEGFLTDVADSLNNYTSFATGLNTNHLDQIISSGNKSQMEIAASGSYQHKFFYGASIGIPFLNYSETSTYGETGFDEFSDVEDFSLGNTYNLSATGINLKIGFIYRPAYWLRLGGSYTSPTWYAAEAQFETILNTQFRDGSTAGPILYFNDNLTYTLRTAQRFSLGTAFVLGKTALLSIDYHGSDLSHNAIKSSLFSLDELDREMDAILAWTNAIRIGGEYRYRNASIRGGYRLQSSPYREALNDRQTDTKTWSIGLGYQFKYFVVDIAWRASSFSEQYQPYDIQYTPPAEIRNSDRMFVAGIQLVL